MARLLSLTTYDSGKEIVVHCRFVIVVILGIKVVRSIAASGGHGGKTGWRKLDECV